MAMNMGEFGNHLSGLVRQIDGSDKVLRAACRAVRIAAKGAIGTYRFGWPALAPSTLKRKPNGDRPLLVTGEFRKSIRQEIRPYHGMVFSEDPRAAWFEFGTSKMPPRPVFGPAIHAAKAKAQADLRNEVQILFKAPFSGPRTPNYSPTFSPLGKPKF